MVIKLKSLLVDIKAEREGDWIEIKEWQGLDPDHPFQVMPTPGLAFCVLSLNDPDYKVARQALIEEATAMKAEGKSEIEIDAVMGAKEGGLIADRLLRGWRGLDEAYDPPAARAMLEKPESRVFRLMIISAAQRTGMRKVEFVKAAEKN